METYQALLLYVLAFIISIFITKALINWWFKVDKNLYYQETQIKLLSMIARQQGVSNEEIEEAKRPMKKVSNFMEHLNQGNQ